MQPTELFAVAAHVGRATSVCLGKKGSTLAVSGGTDAVIRVWSAGDQALEPLAVLLALFNAWLPCAVFLLLRPDCPLKQAS